MSKNLVEQKVIKQDISDLSKRFFLNYSLSVIKERSLPLTSDGLKPVHRKILYSMYELGLFHNKGFKKSARVVGDTLGKYHPHGDSATYEALVRLSQFFNMRYPLIMGQGNFGSINDPKSYAAMRYTECRLSPIAELLLTELNDGYDDYSPNFDGSLMMPNSLPSRLNFLLLNGTEGIAVGLTSKIPSHNIVDVKNATIAYLQNKDCSPEELAEIIQAPDFATGGQIITPKNEIIKNYVDGEGKFTIRARWKIENDSHGKYKIIVYELPQGVSPESIAESFNEIIKPTVGKNKKTLSITQIQKRDFLSSLISGFSDESDKNNPVRFVIYPKSSKVDPEKIMSALFTISQLEINYKMTMVSIDENQRPKNLNIKSVISDWAEYRVVTVCNRLNHKLSKNKNRKEILEGRLIVIKNIKDIIELIQNSKDPKSDLILKFGLTENQAENTLETKLRTLSNLENSKTENELNDVNKEIDKLEKTISSDKLLRNLVIKELENDTNLFADERRTIIKEASIEKLNKESMVVETKATLLITKNGWLTMRKGHDVDKDNLSIKDGEEILEIIECLQSDKIYVVAENGKVFNFQAQQVPYGKGSNIHINNLINIETSKILKAGVVNETTEEYFFLANKTGYGFILNSKELVSKGKVGKQVYTIEDGNSVMFVHKIDESFENNYLVCVSDDKILSFDLKEVPQISKGKGVKLMKNDTMDLIFISNNKDINFEYKNKKYEINLDDFGCYKRRAYAGKKL